MVGIIITGHSNFATGIASAVKLVTGQQKNLEAVDFPDTYSTEELKIKLTEALDKLEECKNIIFFTDIVGGSPFKISAELAATSSKNIKIISGTNLGMLIENVMMRDMDINFDELVETAISTGNNRFLNLKCVGKRRQTSKEFRRWK